MGAKLTDRKDGPARREPEHNPKTRPEQLVFKNVLEEKKQHIDVRV